MKSFKKDILNKTEKFNSDLGVASPHIELERNVSATIEGYVSVVDYNSEFIKIDCGNIYVKISGDTLEISCITSEAIIIKGNIVAIDYLT